MSNQACLGNKRFTCREACDSIVRSITEFISLKDFFLLTLLASDGTGKAENGCSFWTFGLVYNVKNKR